MKRATVVHAIAAIFLLVLVSPAVAELGAGLELFLPSDPDMYGKGLVDNNWPDYVRNEFDWRSGEDRVQLYGPSSYDRLVSPVLFQRIEFGAGSSFSWGFELSERFRWLMFAPAKDVDIVFERKEVPFSLVPFGKLTFGKFDVMFGAGGSAIYATTSVSGKDMFRQEANPYYDPEDEESDEPRAKYESQRFGRSGWTFGWLAKISIGFKLKESLRLGLDVEYSGFTLESLEPEIVDDGYDPDADIVQFHWKEKTISGDAGGIGVILGISYQP